DVHAAVGAAGELPDHPRVDVPEQHLAALGLATNAVDVVEDPLDLRAGEVGRDREPRLGPEPVLASIGAELVADLVRARVLPDDCVEDGPTARALPDDRRLALVRDADAGDVARVDLVEPGPDHLLRPLPDLHRVVLDPARLRVDLLVLLLVDRDNLPAVVEDHEAGACSALVDCCCVLSHSSSLHSFQILQSASQASALCVPMITSPARAGPRSRPRPREAGEMRWLPDPDAPRFARRGSSRGLSSQ